VATYLTRVVAAVFHCHVWQSKQPRHL